MSDESVLIRFPEESKDIGNRYARRLADELAEIRGIGSANTVRDDDAAQDFGSTLVLVLGTASITAVAQGIKNFLSRFGAKAEITLSEGKVILTNLASKDVAEIAKAISERKS